MALIDEIHGTLGKVFFGRLIVRRLPSDDHAGMILLAPAAQEPLDLYEVLSKDETYPVDPARDDVAPFDHIKIGDKVLFGRHTGQRFRWGGEELIAVREMDVFAVVED